MSYRAGSVVHYQGGTWVALVNDPQTDPLTGAGTDWDAIAPVPGRAGMNLSSPVLLPGDIGAGWNILDYFDTESFTAYGSSVDIANGTWDHDFVGLWSENLFLNFYHNSSNQGRTTSLRIWNVTTASEVGRTAIGIGRNVESTSFTYTGYFELTTALLDDVLRWEIGGGDSIQVDQWNNLSFSTIQVSVLA